MGLLDDAIREHLELKRRHGADPEEVSRQEREALGAPQRSAEFAQPEADAPEADVAEETPEPEAGAVVAPHPEDEAPAPEEDVPAGAEEDPWLPDDAPEEEQPRAEAGPDGEDVLEETPEFLQETPEHDRLWFEQRPPKDFDF
jgi:hypothetical protein